MIHMQATKRVNLIRPISITSQTTVSATVNVVGWDYAEVCVTLDTGTNTVTTLDLSEGDTTSSFATNADTNMTTTAGDTNNASVYRWFLDLRKRKKFLKVTVMAGVAARLGYADIILGRGEQAPTTATLQGATGGRVIA